MVEKLTQTQTLYKKSAHIFGAVYWWSSYSAKRCCGLSVYRARCLRRWNAPVWASLKPTRSATLCCSYNVRFNFFWNARFFLRRFDISDGVGLVKMASAVVAKDFLQRAQCSHCKRCISYGNSVRLSVCLSVCPTHAGIVSKRRHVARCSFHRWIAKRV